jgi:hypothetical protein
MNNIKFIVLLVTILGSSSLFAQVYDVNFAGLSFSNGNQTLLGSTSTKNDVGAQVLYNDVIEINGVPIDCIVTNVSGSNTFDVNYSTNSMTNASRVDSMFVPNITTLASFNTFRFEFILGGSYNNGDYQPVVLRNLYLNVYDIDGDNNYREQVRIASDYSQYELFASSANLTGTRTTTSDLFYWQNSSANSETSYLGISDDRNRVRFLFQTVSLLTIELGSDRSNSNQNYSIANNYYLAFSRGTGGVTPVTNNQIVIDLNTSTAGTNQELDYTTCNSLVNFTNGTGTGNQNINASTTQLTNLTISYDPNILLTSNNEFIVIGSTNLNMSSTSGSGSVTVSSNTYNYSISTTTNPISQTSIVFTKTNLTLSEAETLLDAVQFKITDCSAPAGTVIIGVTATLDLTTDITSAKTFFVANLPQALPVNILSFTGKAIAAGNQLNWTVAQEVDFSHYEVLRSDDGRVFNLVGTVFATENSMDMKFYAFVDADAKSDLSYYKLRLVDNNGSVAYSSLVVVSRNNIVPTVSNVFPNPASTQLNVELNGVATDNMTVTIQDLTGKILYQAENVSAQSSVYSFDINSLNRGVYIIRIQDEMGQTSVSRFSVSK